MTWVLRLDTDGTVTRCAGAHLVEEARAHFRLLDLLSPPEVDVCPLAAVRHPSHPVHLVAPWPLVMCVHQWSTLEGFPVNVKAWALYGRSPILGPAFVAFDGVDTIRSPLPDEWVHRVMAPWLVWVPSHVLLDMETIARAQGYGWPT